MRRRLLLVPFLVLAGCSREPEAPPAEPGKVPGSVTTAKGEAMGEIITPQEFAKRAGVPFYPGASAPEDSSNIRKDGKEVRYEIVMITSDSPKKVLAFYQSKLPKGQMVGKQWMGMSSPSRYASVSATSDKGKTRIIVVVRGMEETNR